MSRIRGVEIGAKIGRPKKYTKKFKKELFEKFETYIDDHDIPILAEFAYQNNIARGRLYEFDVFVDAIKRCHDKKEANLEKGLLSGKLNPAGAIFSLKQLGWTDRTEVEHRGGAVMKIIVSEEFKPKKLSEKPKETTEHNVIDIPPEDAVEITPKSVN